MWLTSWLAPSSGSRSEVAKRKRTVLTIEILEGRAMPGSLMTPDDGSNPPPPDQGQSSPASGDPNASGSGSSMPGYPPTSGNPPMNGSSGSTMPGFPPPDPNNTSMSGNGSGSSSTPWEPVELAEPEDWATAYAPAFDNEGIQDAFPDLSLIHI